MNNTFSLKPKVQTKTKLKPAMFQSLNILHMSSDVLSAYLNEQMLSNPLLEWNDTRSIKSEDLYTKAEQFVAEDLSLKQQLQHQP